MIFINRKRDEEFDIVLKIKERFKELHLQKQNFNFNWGLINESIDYH